MRVLVTRAPEQGAKTAATLAALGHEAIISPVINIVVTGAAWPSVTIDCLVATSARAFESLRVEPNFPTPETRRLLPLFLVGEKTRAAAQAAGFRGSAEVAPDVQHLAPKLLAHLRPQMQGLYLAGHGRKPELEALCAESGHPLLVVETYRADRAAQFTPVARAALLDRSIGAVLHYSRRSTTIFLELLSVDWLNPASLRHIAISDDAAEPLRALKLAELRVAVAPTPTEAAMIDLLSAPATLP